MKNYFGLGTPIWMQSRKGVFLFFCIDFTLFISIKTELFNINNNVKLISFTILLSLIWCLTSYINGRYSYFKDLNFHHKIYKIFLSTLLTLTIIYLTDKLLIISISELVPFGRNKIILLGILSFIIQSFKFIMYHNNNFKKILFLYGKKEDINIFKNLLQSNFNSENIELINYNDNDNNINILKNKSIILFGNYNTNNYEKIYSNYIKLNLKIFTPLKWCEKYLHKIPIKYLNNKEYQTNNWIINNDSFEWRLKRFGDIFISLILIILSIPILFLSAILIYLEDRGPIFYYQIRTGLGGRAFKIAKLRTMKKRSEEHGAVWASKNDFRITKIGRFLRKSRIDELPQLISVIIGDMSLIGPRPERPEIEIILKEKIKFYELRYAIKPGLSGWAQVNYPYGASIEDSKNKLSYDLFYIRNYSFWLDILIFIKTIKLVIKMQGSNPIQ